MKLKWWVVAMALAACARADDDEDALDSSLDDDDDLTLREEESRNLQPRAYQQAAAAAYNALPSGFRPAAGGGGGGGGAALADLAGYTRPRPAQRQQHQSGAGGAGGTRGAEGADGEASEEEEREEPDRLSALLQQSRFECSRRPTGYYADEELACEVFHYCQDGVRHSWICPDSFTFHQVHLICMPPTQENICQQSAKYHFVNEYLYRPVNSEEVARKPSVALRYSERYYPDAVYHDDRGLHDEEVEERPNVTPAPTPAQSQPHAGPQVFRSAEEVVIPLGQRRPQRPYDFRF